MQRVRLGKTGITVNKNGFGALPIQRVGLEEAKDILRHACENGVDFYDTARMYTDSEAKIAAALGDVRGEIVLATKTMALTAEAFWADLETSLANLQTGHVELLQLHNPPFCPRPGGEDGLYDAALEAKRQGKVGHIGITNHRLAVAEEALESGLYETLQFPFNYLSGEREKAMVRRCAELDVGFIAMKALSGGLLNDAELCYAWMAEYDNVLPIWGIQKKRELQQFLDCAAAEPTMTPQRRAKVEAERAELSGDFCRGCGYCAPCPVGIEIFQGARMALMIRRAPEADWTTPAWQEKMARIDDCIGCGSCKARCPYGLDIPPLLKRNYEDYKTFI